MAWMNLWVFVEVKLRHLILQISGHRATNVHAHILFRIQEYKWSMLQFTETTPARLGRARQAG